MTDATQAETVRAALTQIDGVESIRLDVPTRRVSVFHAGLPGTSQAICETLRSIGFRALQKA